MERDLLELRSLPCAVAAWQGRHGQTTLLNCMSSSSCNDVEEILCFLPC